MIDFKQIFPTKAYSRIVLCVALFFYLLLCYNGLWNMALYPAEVRHIDALSSFLAVCQVLTPATLIAISFGALSVLELVCTVPDNAWKTIMEMILWSLLTILVNSFMAYLISTGNNSGMGIWWILITTSVVNIVWYISTIILLKSSKRLQELSEKLNEDDSQDDNVEVMRPEILVTKDLANKLFRYIYKEQYTWLSNYFEELGFTREKEYVYKDLQITDTFLHKEKGLSLALTVEFSPRRRTWDVIGVWLMLTDNPSVDKRWSVWRSELVEEKLKKEIVLAVDAFSTIYASYADYDDHEPLYLYSDAAKPLLRDEEYYISENERWIHAKSLGQLYIDAFSSGNISLYDIRPLRIAGGLWEGYDKDGHPTGGILLKEEFCGLVSEHPPLDVLLRNR